MRRLLSSHFRLKFEFFGIPRLRAGVAEFFVDLRYDRNTIGDALEMLRVGLPEIDEACFDGKCLKKEFLLNISGDRFTKEANTRLLEGDSILLLSSDVGG